MADAVQFTQNLLNPIVGKFNSWFASIVPWDIVRFVLVVIASFTIMRLLSGQIEKFKWLRFVLLTMGIYLALYALGIR